MASESVTGKTTEELDELREQYTDRHGDDPEWPSFENKHCLAPIPRQPPDYDGPDRFCILQRDLVDAGDTVRCNIHGPTGDRDSLDKLANMKHGMNATREHLIEDFDEKDEALYDWITNRYPEAYDIPVDEDPQAVYDLHRLAAEVVRAERGRGYLIEEGEIHDKEVRNDEGQVVIDNEGNVVTEKSEHYLAQMMHRQDKKISNLEKELGISRKERLRQDSTDEAVDAVKNFAELGAAFLQRDENDYDPDSEPWGDDG